MEVYNIALFGHRDFCAHKDIERKLSLILQELFREKDFINVHVGRDGEFGVFASSVIKRAKRTFAYENLSISLVLPYTRKDMDFFEKYYDDIIIPESVGRCHPKEAICKRNKWMIEQSNILICYVEKNSGGAYKALKYAKKLNKRIINLADGNSV